MEMSDIYNMYMQRCLELAKKGAGYTAPNPLVGCVIVKNNHIIGEGWHKKYGGNHAEIEAIKSVANKEDIQDAEVYVNLEPCSHYGKTPPCSDALIESKVKKVVIANLDPNPLVQGKGVKKLMDAGVEVVSGVLKEDGYELNRYFFTHHTKKRPYILLKWAESADGFLGSRDKRIQISNEVSNLHVQKLRSEVDAILVGTQTALIDNPKLTNRYGKEKQPLRVIIDKDLKIPPSHHIFYGESNTLILHDSDREFTNSNAEFIGIDYSENIIPQLLDILYQKNILSVLIEGGSHTLQQFIDAKLWDEIQVYKSSQSIKGDVKSPTFKGNLVEQRLTLGDIFYQYKPLP